MRFDIDNDGELNFDEFKNYMADFVKELSNDTYQLSILEEASLQIFQDIDKDGSGRIDKKEMALFIFKLTDR